MINWRDLKTEQPEPDIECLTIMKHGMISGFYDPQERQWSGYYWHDSNWYATKWVPVEELT